MIGQLILTPKGRGRVERRQLYGLPVLRAEVDREGVWGDRRLRRAGKNLRMGGALSVLVPGGFVWWAALERFGLRPMDPEAFVRAQATPLALKALERLGLAPDRATVALRGRRADRDMARTAAELHKKGLLTVDEAERLLGFCNNSNPVFLLSVLGGGVFGSPRAGVYLWLIHVFSALLTGFFFRGSGRSLGRQTLPRAAPCQSPSLPTAFVEGVRSACGSMVYVCGFVLFFYVLASPLAKLGGPLGAGLSVGTDGFPLVGELAAVLAVGVVVQIVFIVIHNRFLLHYVSRFFRS